MDDLISRQAAIDALDDEITITGVSNANIVKDYVLRVKRKLEALPSAQPEPCEDAVNRRKLLNDLEELKIAWVKYPVMAEQIKGVETAIEYVEMMPSVTPKEQPEIIRCKDCKYGVQDEIGRWYCRSLGCQMGDDDGSGFCSDAERREE